MRIELWNKEGGYLLRGKYDSIDEIPEPDRTTVLLMLAACAPIQDKPVHAQTLYAGPMGWVRYYPANSYREEPHILIRPEGRDTPPSDEVVAVMSAIDNKAYHLDFE